MAQPKEEATAQDSLTGKASSKMQEATSVAQEKGSELREQGSVRFREQLDQRSTEMGSQVRSVGEALRRSGNDLGADGNGGAAQLTGQVADRLERLGGYLQEKSGDDFIRDIEGFARRRPWMLAGVGLLAGVAAARFVKASSEERYGADGGSSQRANSSPQLGADSASEQYGRSPGANEQVANESALGYEDVPLVTEETLETSRARSSR